MERWEYKTIQLMPAEGTTGLLKIKTSMWDAGAFAEQLNPYGAQGWELVSCFCTEADVTRGVGGTNGVFAVFKRRA